MLHSVHSCLLQRSVSGSALFLVRINDVSGLILCGTGPIPDDFEIIIDYTIMVTLQMGLDTLSAMVFLM